MQTFRCSSSIRSISQQILTGQQRHATIDSSSTRVSRHMCNSTRRLDEEKTASSGATGWMSRILTGQPYNAGDNVQKQSHSSLLADTDTIYEFTTHDVKCGQIDDYLKVYSNFSKQLKTAIPGAELVGSWTILFGDRDQAVHLWRYTGYEDIDLMTDNMQINQSVRIADNETAKLLRCRHSILTKSFSFWGDPQPREPTHIYDMRRYVLRPGTMIEWANYWARGITYRREHNQDVGGFFAQVGQLYVVYHIWAYKNLVNRKFIREHTWSKPGWDSTVENTVPLIKEMESKIMRPTSLSQLK